TGGIWICHIAVAVVGHPTGQDDDDRPVVLVPARSFFDAVVHRCVPRYLAASDIGALRQGGNQFCGNLRLALAGRHCSSPCACARAMTRAHSFLARWLPCSARSQILTCARSPAWAASSRRARICSVVILVSF